MNNIFTTTRLQPPIVLATLLFLVACEKPETEDPRPLRQLEVRIPGIPYSDQRENRRQAGRNLEAELRDSIQLAEAPSPTATLSSRSLVALLGGDPELAVTLLERVSGIGPPEPDIGPLRAAALLAASIDSGDAHNLVGALEVSSKLVEERPEDLSAQFNRALAVGRLGLIETSIAAWRRYLRAEIEPEWAAEARLQMRALPEANGSTSFDRSFKRLGTALQDREATSLDALVERWPQACREYAEKVLLLEWARFLDSLPSRSSESLAQAKALGRALERLHGDRTIFDTVEHLESLQDPRAVAAAAKALRIYGEVASDDDPSTSKSLLEEAEQHLAELGSPLRDRVALSLAEAWYADNEYDRALQLLDGVVGRTATPKRRAIHGRAHALMGLIYLITGDPAASLTTLRVAREDFEALGETANLSKTATLLVGTSDYLGRREEAWHWLRTALLEMSEVESGPDRVGTLLTGALLAMREGRLHVALVLQNELVRVAERECDAFLLSEAYVARARIHHALGDTEAAQNDLETAEHLSKAIEHDARAREMRVKIQAAGARMIAPASIDEAIAQLSEAIGFLRDTSYTAYLTQTLLDRARALLLANRPLEAERDLEAAILEVERQRSSVVEPQDRVSYLDRMKELYDSMMALQLDVLGRPDRAFEFSERAKARLILDRLALGTAPSSSPNAIDVPKFRLQDNQPGIPPATALIEYAVLPERTLVWVIRSRGAPRQLTLDVTSAELLGEATALRRALMASDIRSADQAADSLHRFLVAPVRPLLRSGENLVIVPDGPLHGLPFGWLRDPESRRRWVQDHPVSLAPSARVLAILKARKEDLGSSPLRVLVASAPAFDRGIHSLEALEPALAIEPIIESFPGSRLLAGRQATKQAFLELSPDYGVLHFGGHSIPNLELPLLSRMLFAPDSGDPSRGVLYAREILQLHLPETQLVVLATCSSGHGSLSATEGLTSLAHPFLAIGVPSVVATLWDVDDPTTSEFFSRFYLHLSENPAPAAALRATQLEYLEDDAPQASHSTSAAFVLIGDGAGSYPPS